jgi:uncharacterized membrane protein YbaN (DUF454 family)
MLGARWDILILPGCRGVFLLPAVFFLVLPALCFRRSLDAVVSFSDEN